MSESNLLKDMCKEIERALPRTKNDHFQVKASFNHANHEKIFERYIKQQ